LGGFFLFKDKVFMEENKIVELLSKEDPLLLDCGKSLGPIKIAYTTYGNLNEQKSNAILICHALTGDQYVASQHPITKKEGWWSNVVGPNKSIDTNKFFVICPNIIGGCMGSTGPKEIDPLTQKEFGLNFPVITISDMVKAQKLLIDYLSIEKLFCVTGGSMGGMLVLEWLSKFPEFVHSAIPIATSVNHSAQNIALNELARQSIMADPNWQSGNYYETDNQPIKGLSVARMAAHISYLSKESLHQKFGRNLQDKNELDYSFKADFQIESYLRHQGISFVDRFDANSYLYITRAMDYFDITANSNGSLIEAFKNTKSKVLCVSFTSDWLYPTSENKKIVKTLNALGIDVSFLEIESENGHDSFLLNEPEFFDALDGFISSTWREL
jgi:homoserine O-acetyltransferase